MPLLKPESSIPIPISPVCFVCAILLAVWGCSGKSHATADADTGTASDDSDEGPTFGSDSSSGPPDSTGQLQDSDTALDNSPDTDYPTSSSLFTVSTQLVEFDSRNDEQKVVVEVLPLVGGLSVYGTAVSPEKLGEPETVVNDVSVTVPDAETARVHIHREGPHSLLPGVYKGKVRVRGCVDGDVCEDIYVDVVYTVVHLELEGYPNRVSSQSRVGPGVITVRRRVDEPSPWPLAIPIRMSDGSVFEWRATVQEAIYDDYTWLTFPSSGSSSDPLVLNTDSMFDTVTSRRAELHIETETTSLDVTIIYETYLPIEVSPTVLNFQATVGEQAAPQTVRVFDAYGETYPWSYRNGRFRFECGINGEFEINVVEGSFDELPAAFTVTPPVAEALPADPERCTGKIEILHMRLTTMVHQYVDVNLTVTE